MKTHGKFAVIAAITFTLAACKSTTLGYEPAPEDTIDGRRLALEAGVNTDMDHGPKQTLLLGEYQKALANAEQLRKELDKVTRDRKVTEGKLELQVAALEKEKLVRTQAEAQVAELQGKRRDLEAKLLSLGIEKAKLEQSALLGKIATLQKDLEDLAPKANETAAPPAGGR